MATRKKTQTPSSDDEAISIAQDLINKVSDLYPVLDEIAGNSNFLKDISESLARIATALRKK